MNVGGLAALMSALLRYLTPDIIRKGIDKFLDVVEDAVAKTPNKIDDVIILALINNIRTALDIPDNDQPINITANEVNVVENKEGQKP